MTRAKRETIRKGQILIRARRIAARHKLRRDPEPTGLRKDCQGCGRRGDVYRGDGRTFIIYEGDDSTRTLTNVTEEELLHPRFVGCGCDDAEEGTP